MPADPPHQILLIAGDYNIIEAVRHALPAVRFNVQCAFNHREALFILGYSYFDALVVDANMVDRYTGVVTIQALADLRRIEPLIALAANGGRNVADLTLADAVVVGLDDADILQTMAQQLEMPTDDRQDGHSPVQTQENRRQSEEIATFFSLSRSLTEVLNLDEVLNRVVEAARHLTRAEEGMILLPEGEDLYLRAKIGIDTESARNFRLRTRDTLAGQVLQTGDPVLIGDSGPQKIKTQYFVNSLLYVPLLLRDEIIGVLGVANKHKTDSFNLHHQQLLINLASFATIAISNARIHQDSLDRARELETLVAASEVLNASLTLEESLPTICQRLASVLDVGGSEIYFWNRDHDYLVLMARHYQAVWRFGHGPAIELADDPVLADQLAAGEYVWIGQGDHISREHNQQLSELGAHAVMMLPVKTDDEIIAILRAYYVAIPREHPSRHMRQHAQYQTIEGIAALVDSSEHILTDQLVQLLRTINEMFDSDWVDLSLPVRDTNRFDVLASLGDGVWLQGPQPFIDLVRYPDLREALESQTMINCRMDDRALPAGNRVFLERTRSRAVLAVPMIQRGQTTGLAVFADTERVRSFDQREINLARAIVGQAATALENAKLVHDLETSLHNLQHAQKRLVHTARLSAMGELAGVVAHQINNPLTTIIVDTELMLMDEQQDSPRSASLAAIAHSGKRAANVVRRLLSIARPVDPDTREEFVDVVDTVRGMLVLLQNHFERDGNIEVLADFPDAPLPFVRSVQGELDDVWFNLLMNAYEALRGRSNGRIGVEVHHNHKHASIDVVIWDNGVGIPADIVDQIFDPFFTTKPLGEGTGLGLHIARQLVENIGGEIEVDSDPDDVTRFTVHLPIPQQ